MQLTHYNTYFNKRTFPVTLICDQVSNAANIGSLFRICDAFGIEKMVLGGSVVLGRKMTKTSRATEKVVPYEICESASNVVTDLKNQGYQIIVLEITATSQAIHKLSFDKNKPIALIIGDENFGVSETIINMADLVAHIDMYGQNSSMNVVQATNIAFYEITKQLRKHIEYPSSPGS